MRDEPWLKEKNVKTRLAIYSLLLALEIQGETTEETGLKLSFRVDIGNFEIL